MKIKNFKLFILFLISFIFLSNFSFVNAVTLVTPPDTFQAPSFDVSSLFTVNDDGTFTIQDRKTICTNYIIFYSIQYDEYNIVFYGDGYISDDCSSYCYTNVSGYNRCFLRLIPNSTTFGTVEFRQYSGKDVLFQDYIIDSYKDVLYSDGTIFFQKTPVTATLAPILEKVEMTEPTMKEILTLVPIMIILIASYLGLRKGLTLLKILRKM